MQYTDFATNLPIKHCDIVLCFLIQSTDTDPLEGHLYSDEIFEPISFPFITQYIEADNTFHLDSHHQDHNQFAWSQLDRKIKNDIDPDTAEPEDVLTEALFQSLLNWIKEARFERLCVTTYATFGKVAKELKNTPSGIGSRPEDKTDTFIASYHKRKFAFIPYKHARNKPIAMPNLFEDGEIKGHQELQYLRQRQIHRNESDSIDHYLIDWTVFTYYIMQLSIPYQPVFDHPQVENLSYRLLQQEIEETRVQKMIKGELFYLMTEVVNLTDDAATDYEAFREALLYAAFLKDISVKALNTENAIQNFLNTLTSKEAKTLLSAHPFHQFGSEWTLFH